jgi:hypothetical protein
MGDCGYPNAIVEIEIDQRVRKPPQRTMTRTRFILGRIQIWILTHALQRSLEFLTKYSA